MFPPPPPSFYCVLTPAIYALLSRYSPFFFLASPSSFSFFLSHTSRKDTDNGIMFRLRTNTPEALWKQGYRQMSIIRKNNSIILGFLIKFLALVYSTLAIDKKPEKYSTKC